MPENCSACKNKFASAKLGITCVECGQSYHAECCRVGSQEKWRKKNSASKAAWKCDVCGGETASNSSKSDTDIPTKQLSTNDVLQALRGDMNSRFDELLQRYANMEANYSSLSASYACMNACLEGFKVQIDKQKQAIEQLQKEKRDLADEVEGLREELCDLQQYTRRNNLEIRGVPVTENEDIYGIVHSVAGALGVPYNRQEISVAHRLGPNRMAKPPAIIVAFVSRTTKETWLTAMRTRKRAKKWLTTKDLRPSLPDGAVYLNDHLTPFNRQLLGAARAMVKSKKLAFAWFSGGKILVRKTADSRPVRISKVDELDIYNS